MAIYSAVMYSVVCICECSYTCAHVFFIAIITAGRIFQKLAFCPAEIWRCLLHLTVVRDVHHPFSVKLNLAKGERAEKADLRETGTSKERLQLLLSTTWYYMPRCQRGVSATFCFVFHVSPKGSTIGQTSCVLKAPCQFSFSRWYTCQIARLSGPREVEPTSFLRRVYFPAIRQQSFQACKSHFRGCR